MTNFREGDSVNIQGCNYEITEFYLSAKSNGSYPKVLAKMLGITNMADFVWSVLGYTRHEGKIFWFKSMEDCNKLIVALKEFKWMEAETSTVLKDASIKKFFEDEDNLERLEGLSANIGKLLTNFNKIKTIASNVITKVTAKNKDLVKSIDTKNVKMIGKLETEFASILEFVTTTDEVLASLNGTGAENADEAVEFNADTFINGEAK